MSNPNRQRTCLKALSILCLMGAGLAMTAAPALAQSRDEPAVRTPPRPETPSKSPGFMVGGIVILGVVLTFGAALFPSNRAVDD